MLHTEPTGRYVVSVCTNIACMLRGAYELLEHAEEHLGIRSGGTTADQMFTLEEAECLADCGMAPCVQVNHRFFGDVTDESFDRLIDDLLRRTSRRRGAAPRDAGPGQAQAVGLALCRRCRRRSDRRMRSPTRRRSSRRGSATRTRTPSSAISRPAATTGCARRSR